jgi:hypothetical protein
MKWFLSDLRLIPAMAMNSEKPQARPSSVAPVDSPGIFNGGVRSRRGLPLGVEHHRWQRPKADWEP